MDKYITVELWPEGEVVRSGKYTEVNKVQREKLTKGVTIGEMKTIWESFKTYRYDILNSYESISKFCGAICERSERAN